MDIANNMSWTMRMVFIVEDWADILWGIELIIGIQFHGLKIGILWAAFYERFGESVVYNLGRSLVKRLYRSSREWRWQRNITQFIYIMSQPPLDFKLDLEEDSVVWLPHPSGCYSVHFSWEAIRHKLPIQQCGMVGIFTMLVLYFVAACTAEIEYQRHFELGNEGRRGLHPMWQWKGIPPALNFQCPKSSFI